LAQDDPFLQSSDDLGFFLYGDGDFLKLDADGRIQLNDFIREHAGITDRVAFVGRGRHFQMWEPGRLSEYGSAARARLLKLRRNEAPSRETATVQGEPEQ
jgi:MraZ protein